MKAIQVTVQEITVPRVWTCDSCGFENKPHVNRRRADQHALCEQCGQLEPSITSDVYNARGSGHEVRYA